MIVSCRSEGSILCPHLDLPEAFGTVSQLFLLKTLSYPGFVIPSLPWFSHSSLPLLFSSPLLAFPKTLACLPHSFFLPPLPCVILPSPVALNIFLHTQVSDIYVSSCIFSQIPRHLYSTVYSMSLFWCLKGNPDLAYSDQIFSFPSPNPHIPSAKLPHLSKKCLLHPLAKNP